VDCDDIFGGIYVQSILFTSFITACRLIQSSYSTETKCFLHLRPFERQVAARFRGAEEVDLRLRVLVGAARRYISRYIRRPPIAEYRLLSREDQVVRFWTNDKKLDRQVTTAYAAHKFVVLLADQVPNRYRHSVRCFIDYPQIR
jgi:hypothetical protein